MIHGGMHTVTWWGVMGQIEISVEQAHA